MTRNSAWRAWGRNCGAAAAFAAFRQIQGNPSIIRSDSPCQSENPILEHLINIIADTSGGAKKNSKKVPKTDPLGKSEFEPNRNQGKESFLDSFGVLDRHHHKRDGHASSSPSTPHSSKLARLKNPISNLNSLQFPNPKQRILFLVQSSSSCHHHVQRAPIGRSSNSSTRPPSRRR